MTQQTIFPVSDQAFDRKVFYKASAKAHHGGLEERASLTDLEISHLCVYDREDAERAMHTRAQALEELERRRWVVQAQAATAARAPTTEDAAAQAHTKELHEPIETWEAFVQKHPGQKVTVALLDDLVQAVRDIQRFVLDMDNKNKGRNERLATLEQRPQLRFRDAWDASSSYSVGDIVTHGGTAWIAKLPSSGVTPTTGDYAGQAWAVLASRGRDGRPGRDGKDR